MTVGFTGVIWFPRGATWNSTALNAGVGPVGFSAASAAWTAIAAGLADATAAVTKVTADLAAGWEGVASDAALAKLAPFQVWTQRATATATTTAAKAAAEAAAHTVARTAMPSAAEIAAVKASKVAAHTVGGSLAGVGAVAEAADRALDVRAALVMEAYESASSIVAVPQHFTAPPPLASGGAAPTTPPPPVPPGRGLLDFAVHPAQAAHAALGAVLAGAQDPTVVAAASQAGTLAGTGVTAVAGTAAMLSPAASALREHVLGGGAVLGADPVAGARDVRVPGGGAASGRAVVGAAGYGAAGASGPARVTLPDGWGGIPGGGAASGGRGAPVDGLPSGAEPAAAEPGARTTPAGGAPMAAGRGPDTDEDEHRTPGYLRKFEHFEDGRVVIPSVIGADPADR
ncbi:PPE domain-containing protein [Rhodococcus sp. NPDC003318]|uniref:PPE domain-containing protein n=1 Tax=Rhodococcus sp. NPDC003318 TaxID=3364503 RepID=UPI0036749FF9